MVMRLMAIACRAALTTSRYLVPGKFAVTKNLSNASQICRICSPSKKKRVRSVKCERGSPIDLSFSDAVASASIVLPLDRND